MSKANKFYLALHNKAEDVAATFALDVKDEMFDITYEAFCRNVSMYVSNLTALNEEISPEPLKHIFLYEFFRKFGAQVCNLKMLSKLSDEILVLAENIEEQEELF